MFRKEGDWKQWQLLTADITNSRDSISLYYIFKGSLNGVQWEAEAGVAAAKGQFSPTGASNLSRLSIESDLCS